jgi:hypothetical protein
MSNPLFSDKQRLYFQGIAVKINKALRTFYALEESFDRNLEDLGWLWAKRKRLADWLIFVANYCTLFWLSA